MNNDLISREALKKELQSRPFPQDYSTTLLLGTFNDLIDNAPTIFDCRSCKNNGNERECVDCHEYSNFVRYETTPEGEWLNQEEPFGNYSEVDVACCSHCHESYVLCEWGFDDLIGEYKYCPNCGAKMKNGGGEK